MAGAARNGEAVLLAAATRHERAAEEFRIVRWPRARAGAVQLRFRKNLGWPTLSGVGGEGGRVAM